MPPLLILAGADKGGVGKTMLTRALLDHPRLRGRTVRVFDGEAPHGALKRFYPAAEIVDLSETSGQMRILDALSVDAVTVVDLPSGGVLYEFLASLRQIGLLADVERRKVDFIVFHLLEGSVASLEEIGRTAAQLVEGGDHVLVKNCGSKTRFEWQENAHAKYFARIGAKSIIEIPHLDGMVIEAADRRGGSFREFLDDARESYVLKGKLSHWLRQLERELDKAGLAPLIAL